MLFVFKLSPSALAPYFTILKVSFLKAGNATTGSFGISLASEGVPKKSATITHTNNVFIMISFIKLEKSYTA
jgi:hypothetical protein